MDESADQKTLAKKEAGTLTYRSLDEVMLKFGFDARYDLDNAIMEQNSVY